MGGTVAPRQQDEFAEHLQDVDLDILFSGLTQEPMDPRRVSTSPFQHQPPQQQQQRQRQQAVKRDLEAHESDQSEEKDLDLQAQESLKGLDEQALWSDDWRLPQEPKEGSQTVDTSGSSRQTISHPRHSTRETDSVIEGARKSAANTNKKTQTLTQMFEKRVTSTNRNEEEVIANGAKDDNDHRTGRIRDATSTTLKRPRGEQKKKGNTGSELHEKKMKQARLSFVTAANREEGHQNENDSDDEGELQPMLSLSQYYRDRIDEEEAQIVSTAANDLGVLASEEEDEEEDVDAHLHSLCVDLSQEWKCEDEIKPETESGDNISDIQASPESHHYHLTNGKLDSVGDRTYTKGDFWHKGRCKDDPNVLYEILGFKLKGSLAKKAICKVWRKMSQTILGHGPDLQNRWVQVGTRYEHIALKHLKAFKALDNSRKTNFIWIQNVDPKIMVSPRLGFSFTHRLNNPIKKIIQGRPQVLELFGGCGGMSQGFERAGFDVKWIVEVDTSASLALKVSGTGQCRFA